MTSKKQSEAFLFKKDDIVLIIKPNDIFYGYKAKIRKKIEEVSFYNSEGYPIKYFKVLLDLTLKSPRTDKNNYRTISASNIQYRDFSEQELIPFSKISRLLYS